MPQSSRPAIPIALQTRQMQKDFPDFVFRREKNAPTWRGLLQPTEWSHVYAVKVVYRFADRHSECPRVWTISPEIRRDAPHRYSDDSLCLFFPPDRSWTPNAYISKTIVPWIALWLAFYEIWLDTDHWYGPEAAHKGKKR